MYHIYDKVPLKLMSLFIVVKGCVNFHEMTSVHKKTCICTLNRLGSGSVSKNDCIAFKFNSSLFLLSD
jgi:hypothetical protein